MTADVQTFEVHVQPRASRTEVAGLYGTRLKIRVRAVPTNGAANKELVALVAEQLGVPRAAVHLVSGASSRRKRLRVDGWDANTANSHLLGQAP